MASDRSVVSTEGDGPLAWMRMLRPEPWMALARCAEAANPDVFFPEKGESSREAQLICVECPVRAQCAEYALERGEQFGVWGGISAMQRLHRKRGGSGVKIGPIEDASIRRMALAGMNDSEIASRMGVADRTVARARSRLGLATPRRVPRRWTAEEVEKVRDLNRQGLSDAEIARRIDRDEQVARAKRRELGLAANFGPGGRRIRGGAA